MQEFHLRVRNLWQKREPSFLSFPRHKEQQLFSMIFTDKKTQHHNIDTINAIMKLFVALLLTLAVQNQAVEDLPNLRGVAGIALTKYGPSGMAACRKVDQWCSTTSTDPRFQCCDVDELGTTQSLTCQESATVSNPSYNGKCVASSS
jgi:hypothetical protein